MWLITERTKVRTVADRWRSQYSDGGPEYDREGKIQIRLDALDTETATAADVEKLIGNSSWCWPSTCDECGDTTYVAVMVGEEPDYESRTAVLCPGCVSAAMALIALAMREGGE